MQGKSVYRTAIIGLGYVGLPLAQLFLNKGHIVYGIDTDSYKINKILRGERFLNEISAEQMQQMVSSPAFRVGSEYDVIGDVDVVIICVPTPLNRQGEPDLSYVRAAMSSALPYLKKGHLVVLESTTYPGTTENILLPMLEAQGLVVGKEVALAYSPERIDPGQKQYELDDIPKVISGVTEACQAYANTVYKTVFKDVITVSSPKIAEMTKLLENCQRYINISFMNEMAMLCDKMGIDLWEVITAAETKPYGFTPYYPGPGIGGHCIPIDPMYLLWKAHTYHFDLQMVRLARDINDRTPPFVVRKVARCLRSSNVSVMGSRILVIGVTYKKDVNDLRESPAPVIMKGLTDLGADVHFYDPFIEEKELAGAKRRADLTADTLVDADCVLILTDHSSIPYDLIARHASLIVDTRNAMEAFNQQENIVLL